MALEHVLSCAMCASRNWESTKARKPRNFNLNRSKNAVSANVQSSSLITPSLSHLDSTRAQATAALETKEKTTIFNLSPSAFDQVHEERREKRRERERERWIDLTSDDLGFFMRCLKLTQNELITASCCDYQSDCRRNEGH